MQPVLFSLGPFHLYSFGLMVALGVFISIFFMVRIARRDKFPPHPNDVYDLVFLTVFGGFLGARLFYIFQNRAGYAQNPWQMFAFWEGGIIFYGGVVGSLTALFIFARWKGQSLLKILDFLLPFVALTHAFGRIGCFLNGCCYGRVCHLPWAVAFPDIPEPRHPTQIYEAIFNFFLFLFLNERYRRKRFTGEVTGLYFMFYAVGRFVIEFWRADNPSWYFLTWNQWLSVVLFLTAGLFFLKWKKA